MHDILICACLKVGREADRSHKNKKLKTTMNFKKQFYISSRDGSRELGPWHVGSGAI